MSVLPSLKNSPSETMIQQKLIKIGGIHSNDLKKEIIVEDKLCVTINHETEQPCKPIEPIYKEYGYLTRSIEKVPSNKIIKGLDFQLPPWPFRSLAPT